MPEAKYFIGKAKLTCGKYAKQMIKAIKEGKITPVDCANYYVTDVIESGYKIYTDNNGYSNEYKSIKKAVREELRKAFPESDLPLEDYESDATGMENGKKRYRHTIFLRINEAEKATQNLVAMETESTTTPAPVEQTETKKRATEPAKTSKTSNKPNTIEAMIEMINPEIKKQAEQAIKHLGIDWKELLERSLSSYCKSVNNRVSYNSEDLSDIATDELLNNRTYSTHPNRSYELVKRAIRAIKMWNKQHPEPIDQWSITQSALTRLTGADSNKCKQILEQFKTEVDDYNKRFDNPSLQNRKRDKRAIEQSVNLAELVPNGIE